MAQRLRILIPVLGFGRAGGYRVLSELASHWARSGHDVSFMAPADSAPPYFPTAAKIEWIDSKGQPVADCRGSAGGGASHVFSGMLALWRGLRRGARHHDVVLANQSLTAWPVAFSGGGARKCYYVQAYEPEYYWDSGGIKQALLGLAAWASYRLPLMRIVNAPIYLDYRNLRAREWSPPGIDLQVFGPRDPVSALQDPLVMGCIGRAERVKGTALVVEAYRELLGRGRSVHLRVAYGNVEHLARGLPGVEVVVPANDRELGDFYRSLDVLVAAGLAQHGAVHYPVLEAMACGVPVICTPYLPANSSNSMLVPAGDSSAIARQVEQLMERPELIESMTTSARRAAEDFAWDRVATAFLKMLAR